MVAVGVSVGVISGCFFLVAEPSCKNIAAVSSFAANGNKEQVTTVAASTASSKIFGS